MRIFLAIAIVLSSILTVVIFPISRSKIDGQDKVKGVETELNYWFLLLRKSEKEFLYHGEPGNELKSTVVSSFKVKTGVPGKRPTPLPQLLGRGYWVIVDSWETDNPETAPYFIQLNVPVSEDFPFGPTPYLECDGQCNWEIPGAFGLHGVGGEDNRLSPENEGSSGCIRHSDRDITYLYSILKEKKDVRYYIKDL